MDNPASPSLGLTEEQAHRLLARAVALDAQRRDAVSLVDLRAAAVEAGIDPRAFDRAVAEVGVDAREAMTPLVLPSRWAPVVANLKAAFAFWVALTLLTRVDRLFPADWTVRAVFDILALGIGVWFAFRFRARLAQVVLGGFSVALISLFVIRLAFGIDAAQGGPTHFAVLLAGLLGVSVTALSVHLTRRGTGLTPTIAAPANVRSADINDTQTPPASDTRGSQPFRLVRVAAV